MAERFSSVTPKTSGKSCKWLWVNGCLFKFISSGSYLLVSQLRQKLFQTPQTKEWSYAYLQMACKKYNWPWGLRQYIFLSCACFQWTKNDSGNNAAFLNIIPSWQSCKCIPTNQTTQQMMTVSIFKQIKCVTCIIYNGNKKGCFF